MFSQRALEIQLRKILHVTVNISCRWVTLEYNCLFESSGLLIHTHWYWSNPVSGEGPNNSMPITMMTYPRTIRGTLSAYNTIYNRKINIFKDNIEESKWFCNACCKIWIDFSFWKLVVKYCELWHIWPVACVGKRNKKIAYQSVRHVPHNWRRYCVKYWCAKKN